MEINTEHQDESILINISGSIDERGAEEMKRRFLELDADQANEVILDFQKVSFIGSAGIGKLLLFYKSMANHGGKVKIINMAKDIYTMFKVVKLDKIFELSPQ